MHDVWSLWYDVVSLPFDDGTSAIYLILPMRSGRYFELRTMSIEKSDDIQIYRDLNSIQA